MFGFSTPANNHLFLLLSGMEEINFTIVKKRATPLVQFAVAVLIGWTGMLICKLAHTHDGEEYFAAFIAIIFFTIINTVVSIAYDSYLRYTVPSYYIYVVLVAVLFLSAKYFSGISIWTLKEYRMMLFCVSIFFLIASTFVRAIKLIVTAAENGF